MNAQRRELDGHRLSKPLNGGLGRGDSLRLVGDIQADTQQVVVVAQHARHGAGSGHDEVAALERGAGELQAETAGGASDEPDFMDEIGGSARCVHDCTAPMRTFDTVSTGCAWLPGMAPKTCCPHRACRHTAPMEVPAISSRPTGTICSPRRMPSRPISATTGGAGDRTPSRL